MKTVKVHNPATLLHIINGGKRMATARKPAARKTNARKPNTAHRTANRKPNTRRNSSIVVLTPAQARAQGVPNPHRRRRRSNPAVKGMIVDAMWAWGGGIATNLVAGLIPLHLDGLAGIGVRFGAAWLTGFIGEKVFGPHAGQMMAIGGGAAAAGELVNYAFGKVGSAGTGLLNPHVQAQVAAGQQGAVPPPPGGDSMQGYDPNYMITDGMHDIMADPSGGMADIYGYTM